MKRHRHKELLFFLRSGLCSGLGLGLGLGLFLLAGCADDPVMVNVTVQVSGPGSVVSEPPGIDCGSTCTAAFAAGTLVSLKTQPQSGAKVQSFGGSDCPVGSPQCFFTLFKDVTSSAQFAPLDPTCSDGAKNGTETDVDCGGTCAPCGIDGTCVQNSDCNNAQCLAGACSACQLGTNLVFNGDAERTLASGMVPGWNLAAGFQVEPYGSGNLAVGDPGPPQRGLNFFSGGLNAQSSATTMIDLSMCAGLINRKPVQLDVAGWLGGQLGQDDNMVVQFGIKQGSAVTSQLTLGPVLAVDRNNVTGLVLRQKSIILPPGTCGLQIVMTATRIAGFSNDGYADSLSAMVSLP